MEEIHGIHKLSLQSKNSLFFIATSECVNCSLFLKNVEKLFCNLTYKKIQTLSYTIKIYCNMYRKIYRR